jgi:SAM-dependent methyltransferase
MLAHLEQRAEDLGLGGRVVTRRADLDVEVPSMEPVDLAWASASLHHLADPDRTLTELATLIRPGGLLAVLELDGLPRFLPDETPGGDAESHAQALMKADRSRDMPTMGSDWGSRLTRAGLDIEQHRAITLELAPPIPELVGRYAAATLARIRDAVADRLEPAELLAFDALLDGGPHDVRHRDDLRVSARRWLWIARRTAL